MDEYFNNAVGTKLSASDVARAVVKFMREDTSRRYKIFIGSDSEGHAGDNTDFVTAVVVHRVGNGGRFFWRRAELKRFHNLHDRIIQEVLLSLDAAKEILESLRKFKDVPDFDFEIHIDVGEKGETRSMTQEVIGMVRAYNFEPRIKPESYAATNVADRYV
ncbi:MAG: hypothetical protein D4Q79_01130 [Spirochaetia bacterium]|nr:MAG: hypothetical protein D4Q79_01130 [Spirochaetia bacterium]